MCKRFVLAKKIALLLVITLFQFASIEFAYAQGNLKADLGFSSMALKDFNATANYGGYYTQGEEGDELPGLDLKGNLWMRIGYGIRMFAHEDWAYEGISLRGPGYNYISGLGLDAPYPSNKPLGNAAEGGGPFQADAGTGETITYYPSGRIESRTLDTPDEFGNVYYHYMDDSLNLMDVSRLAVANANGELAFEYSYHIGTSVIQYKNSFTDAGRLLKYAIYEYDINANLITETTYSYATNQLSDSSYAYEGSNPQINANGKVVWQGSDGYDGEIFLYDGNSVIKITDNFYDDWNPQINANGYIVWCRMIGGDNEIFLYDGSSIIQLTNNSYDDRVPQINASGKVVWEGSDGNDDEIFLYNGSSVIQLTDNWSPDWNPQINDTGEIVWEGWNGNDEIFLYDGSSITQITNNSISDSSPRISANGHIVWRGIVGGDYEIFLYDGSSIIRLTYNLYDDYSPQINANGEVVWSEWDGNDYEIFLYDGSSTIQLTDNDYNDYSPQINTNGEIVWEGANGGDLEIFLYDGSSIIQLTDNTYNDSSPQINADSKIVWATQEGIFVTKLNHTISQTITYYVGSGRIESRTLVVADSFGNIYYHYMDEPFNLMDISQFDVANANGEIAFAYIYHAGTGIIQYKDSFTDVARAVQYARYEYNIYNNLIKIINYQSGETTTYYVPSGRLETKMLTTPDAGGNIYYHYMDTSENLMDVSQLETANGNGEMAFEYIYHAGTSVIQFKDSFTDINRQGAYARYEYDVNGNLIKMINYQNGETTTYYVPSGRLETKMLTTPDADGNIYYHYMNDSLNLMDVSQLAVANANGEIAFEYTYFSGTDIIQIKDSYTDIARAQQFGRYIYFQSGRMQIKILMTPDAEGNIWYRYSDDPLNLMIESRRAVANENGEIAFRYKYYIGTSTIQFKDSYSDIPMTEWYAHYEYDAGGNLTKIVNYETGETTTYYAPSGRLESKLLTTPDAEGNIYFHYIDDVFNMMDILERAYANENDEMAFTYEYYEGTSALHYKYSFRDRGRLSPYARYEYDTSGNLIVMTLAAANDNGEIAFEYTYYPEGGAMQFQAASASMIQSQAGVSGVHFIDSFTDPGRTAHYARYEYDVNGSLIFMTLDQPNANGEIAFEYIYYPDSDVVQYVNSFFDVNRNAQRATYEYDTNGRLIGIINYQTGETTTYYAGSGIIESWMGSWPDASGNIYYHYLDEDWQSQGWGRVDKQVRDVPDADGGIAYEYEYAPGTDTVILKRVYAQHGGRTYTHTNLGIAGSVGSYPYYIEITPDGKYAYITNYGSNSISVIDLDTYQKVGSDIPTGNRPGDIQISRDGAYAYFTNCGDDTVSVIDLSTNEKVTNDIPVGNFPWAMAITPDNKYLYVVNAWGGTVSVIDLATNQKIGNDIVMGGTPNHITITPDGHYAYITKQSGNTVAVIDLTTNTKLPNEIIVGNVPAHSAVTPDGKYVYVANYRDGTVSIIDTATNTTLPEVITVGTRPEAIVISFDGKYAYVTNSGDDTISIINLATNTKLGSDVNVGDLPKDLAVRPGNQHVYVVNNLDGAVSLVEVFVPTYNVTDPRNPEFDYLQATYTYYENSWGNQMESKTLAVADDAGNIYYHYEKETGWNLMDVSQRLIANREGEIAFEYTYFPDFPGSGVVQYKDSFKDIARTAQYARYEYDPNGNLITRTIYAYAINQLANGLQSSSFPKISTNGMVVWSEDDGMGNEEIFLYDGSSVIQITDNSYPDFEPQVNANGQIVWVGLDGGDQEIFFYDGSSIIQITNNDYNDYEPQLNVNGKFVWYGGFPNNEEIFLYDGSSVVQLTFNSYYDGDARISADGKVVWNGWNGNDGEIFFYNGVSTIQLTDNLNNDYFPQINANGEIIWAGWDGHDMEIFLYDGDSPIQLTYNSADDYYPQINDNGYVVWQGWDGTDYEIFLYDGSSIIQLTDNWYADVNPQINANGEVVWEGRDDGNTREIFLYDGSSIIQITDNFYDAERPMISENGYIAWWRNNEIFIAKPNNVIGETTMYYPESGRVQSRLFDRPDADGNIYYEYEDTPLNLMTVSQLASANAEGEIAFEYTYHTGTTVIQYKDSFMDVNRQVPYATYEYDIYGTLIRETYYQTPQAASNYIAGSVSAEELMSKEEAIRKNQADFTGYSPKAETSVGVDIL